MRMLVVDEMEPSRARLTEILLGAGYDVEAAEGVARAKEILARGQIDLLLTDVVMQGLSGLSLLSEFKRTAPEVLVLLTADARNAPTAEEALRHGAFDFVVKPVDHSALLLAIERASELHALRRQRARLESEVASQSAVLAARNVALERLQRAQREQLDFLVHDFRNPLTTIQANLDTLLSDGELAPAESRRALHDALSATKRLGDMVSDLLDIGRSSDGRLTPQIARFPARPFFAELIERHATRAKARGSSITMSLADPDFAIEADPELARRMLSNLIENALHYGGHGVRITLSAGAHASGGQLLAVADDGPGVTEELLERIFDRYERGTPDQLGDQPGGYGLGLTFCKVAARAHRGTIQALANSPHGLRIEIVLPKATET